MLLIITDKYHYLSKESIFEKNDFMKIYKLHDLKEIKEASLFYPPSMESIQKCFYDFKNEFNVELPDGYLDFLKVSNGYIWKSLVVFGTRLQQMPDKDVNLDGIIEKNRYYYPQIKLAGFIVLGSTSDFLIVFDTKNQNYRIINSITNEIYRTFDSLKSVLFHYTTEGLE